MTNRKRDEKERYYINIPIEEQRKYPNIFEVQKIDKHLEKQRKKNGTTL